MASISRLVWCFAALITIITFWRLYPRSLFESEEKTNHDSTRPPARANATFVTLARNREVWDVARSIGNIENRFNYAYKYDWVFLNEEPFDDMFIKVTSAIASGRTKYGQIPKEHWSYPDFIDQTQAAKARVSMKDVYYGPSESYRHMCRYESGFFFRHPLMLEYDFYWRVEPGIKLFCDLPYDPFQFMKDNDKKYSFVISLHEIIETVTTLWDATKEFVGKNPHYIANDNNLQFLSGDNGETWNYCHFWSNFEIGSMDWLRSEAYLGYFDHLDRKGGFFYERWGDAPVHSIAASLFLPKEKIHFFDDIGYLHSPFQHCPTSNDTRARLNCDCNIEETLDIVDFSCTKSFIK